MMNSLDCEIGALLVNAPKDYDPYHRLIRLNETMEIKNKDIPFTKVATGWYVSNVGGIAATGILAFTTSITWILILFIAAVALHIGEAVFTAIITRDSKTSRAWTGQTLAVGFPSLIALHRARTNS